MDDVTQIRVGKHMTGIIGLKSAMAEAVTRCKGMTDEQIGRALLEVLAKSNYIEARLADEYARAFVREYNKHIGRPVTDTAEQELCVKVIGPGCAQCDQLEHEVMAVLSENGISARLEHVRDVAEIARLGVMGVPALLINNRVKAVGSVPPRQKIKAWIIQAAEESGHPA